MNEEIEDSDIELFLKCIEGQKSYDKLYYRYKDSVYRIIKRRCHNWTDDFDDLKDLNQKVWIKLFRTKKHYTEMSFKTLLVRICISVCNDGYKNAETHEPLNTKPVSIDENFQEDTVSTDVSRPDEPDDLIMYEDLLAAIYRLSEDERDVLILKIEGMTNREIAQALELTEEQVKYRLKLARNKLAK
jgi:RNA polymerase sigma factor (sigma-70 family)